MAKIGRDFKGFDNHYMLRGKQECPHVLKYGTMACLKDCPYPEKCYMEMRPDERYVAIRVLADNV